MGKGSSAPAAPDPYKTASAQTGTNVATTIANQHLGNVNQVTPYGSLTYDQTGTYNYTDPTSGKTYDLPTYTATQSLSPHQQQLMGINNQTQTNLANLGRNQSANIMSTLSNPMSGDMLPLGSDTSVLSTPEYTQASGGPDLTSNLNVGSLQRGMGNAGSINGGIADAGNVQTGVQGLNSISGNLGQSGDISGSYGSSGDITRSYGTDFEQGRNEVQDALMSRLNPSLERDKRHLEARLASQGIAIGSEAYANAMGDHDRKATDARMQAILAGGQEQSRLAGLEANRAQFENSAQQQGFNQLDRRNSVANAAQGQQFGQGLQSAQFANTAQQQGFNQAMGLAGLNNAGQAQRFGQNQAQTAQGNAAQAQRFGQGLQSAQFANQAQGQAFAQGQGMNAASQQQYANNQSANQINNALQDQAFNAQLTKNSALDAARQRALQEQLTMRNQPINEVSALMGGAQIQGPNFINPNTPQMPTTDIAGLINNGYQQQMAAYNNRQNSKDKMWGTLGGLGQAYITGGMG